MNVLLYAARQELPITQLPIETVYLDGNQSSHFDPLRDTLRIYRRMLDTARGSVLAWLLHVAAILLLSLTLGWHFFLFSIPLCGAGSAALSYCFNRFLVFRRVRYACGPRMLFGAAVRTSLRLLFCCILHPLGLPLFAAWLIGSVLTVPLEYAYVRLTGVVVVKLCAASFLTSGPSPQRSLPGGKPQQSRSAAPAGSSSADPMTAPAASAPTIWRVCCSARQVRRRP